MKPRQEHQMLQRLDPHDSYVRERVREAQRAQLEEERALVGAEIAELQARTSQELPTLEEAVTSAEKAFRPIEKKYLAAKEAFEKATRARDRYRSQSHDTLERLRARLRVSLPFPEIEEARRRLVKMQDETRELRPDVVHGEAQQDRWGNTYHPVTHSQAPAIDRRLQYLTDAVQPDSGALAQAAAIPGHAECVEAIAQIFAGIPEVGEPEALNGSGGMSLADWIRTVRPGSP